MNTTMSYFLPRNIIKYVTFIYISLLLLVKAEREKWSERLKSECLYITTDIVIIYVALLIVCIAVLRWKNTLPNFGDMKLFWLTHGSCFNFPVETLNIVWWFIYSLNHYSHSSHWFPLYPSLQSRHVPMTSHWPFWQFWGHWVEQFTP